MNAGLLEKYGDMLGPCAKPGRLHGTGKKVKWAFSAAEDLKEFCVELSRGLEIVKLLILSETKNDVGVVVSSIQDLHSMISSMMNRGIYLQDTSPFLRIQDRIDER